MIVITLTDCPISLRGDLTKWLLEINTGVFVGRVSARVRDNLWDRVVKNVKNGRATLVYSTNNEQHMDFRIHHSENEIIDFDGLKLVMKTSHARAQKLAQRRMGFSRAAKMRMAHKAHNRSAEVQEERQFIYPENYVVIDLETTGLDAKTHEIIEVGLLKVCRGRVVGEFQVLLKPKKAVPDPIVKLTGITNALLEKEGKLLPEVLPQIRSLIGDSALVGHNVMFDIGFLNQALQEQNHGKLENQYFDTMKMYASIYNPPGGRRKLADIITEFGISKHPCHRARSDCNAVQAVYEELKKRLKH